MKMAKMGHKNIDKYHTQKHSSSNWASEMSERTVFLFRACQYLLLRMSDSRFDALISKSFCLSVRGKPLFFYVKERASSTLAPQEISITIIFSFCLKVAEIKGIFKNLSELPRFGSAPCLSKTQATSKLFQCTAAWRAVPPLLSRQLMSTPFLTRYQVALMALTLRSSQVSNFLTALVSLATSCALMRKLTVEKSLTWMLTGCDWTNSMKRSTSALSSKRKAFLSSSVGLSLGLVNCLQALTRPDHFDFTKSILYTSIAIFAYKAFSESETNYNRCIDQHHLFYKRIVDYLGEIDEIQAV